MKNKFIISLCLVLFVLGTSIAQPPENWFNLDNAKDGVLGVSTERTYDELLKGKQGKKVIVAVIDSGIDVEHEDLKDIMWVNKDEIPNNGKDDDNNGYIDDIHGWNFLGNKNGKNVNADNLEVARLYKKYHDKYKDANRASLSKKEKKEYDLYLETKEEVEGSRSRAEAELANLDNTTTMVNNAMDAVETALDGKEFTKANVEAIVVGDDQDLTIGQRIALNLLEDGISSIDEAKEAIDGQLSGARDYYQGQLDHHYNPDFDARAIVGDDYDNPYEKGYGNNDYEGPDAFHGTHVAGIIAAIRNNDIGINGVADNVEIMTLRAVPDGDERDKDVANAIRYAVDNGASIINMSFGKGFSWNKGIVDEAVKYAAKKDVLLVHAAGNSSLNTDVENNFPNDTYEKRRLFCKNANDNWIEVGALSWKGGEDAPATFSNYAKENVDLFAPGTAIYSTVPDSEYKNAQGTSMASPVVAGVAAVIRSYYPSLTAAQVKEVLMSSVVAQKQKVKTPGDAGKLVTFKDLAVSGGVVNLYNAVKLAEKTKGKKKGA